MARFANTMDFNPRSPWGERRNGNIADTRRKRFQSTLPVGGATEAVHLGRTTTPISIHAPRGGSDHRGRRHRQRLAGFQSTLPVGGATGNLFVTAVAKDISIHAPRGGSDRFPPRYSGSCKHFNPRSPWGERPWTGWM